MHFVTTALQVARGTGVERVRWVGGHDGATVLRQQVWGGMNEADLPAPVVAITARLRQLASSDKRARQGFELARAHEASGVLLAQLTVFPPTIERTPGKKPGRLVTQLDVQRQNQHSDEQPDYGGSLYESALKSQIELGRVNGFSLRTLDKLII